LAGGEGGQGGAETVASEEEARWTWAQRWEDLAPDVRECIREAMVNLATTRPRIAPHQEVGFEVLPPVALGAAEGEDGDSRRGIRCEEGLGVGRGGIEGDEAFETHSGQDGTNLGCSRGGLEGSVGKAGHLGS